MEVTMIINDTVKHDTIKKNSMLYFAWKLIFQNFLKHDVCIILSYLAEK